MARQKKESPPSILRRVTDRTPLRPATLRNFVQITTGPARFAARYFERNSGLVQRYLNLGGENSPLHRPISLNIVTRFTAFNQSFGPIQRALRPQVEHTPRPRPQVEENAGFADPLTEESGSFDYAPEPAYFNQPQPQPSYTQPTYPDYGAARPAQVSWEAPLNVTPPQIARRIDFQPANLRYINSPERQIQRPNRPAQAPVARTVQPGVPFAAAPAPVVPASLPQTPSGQPATQVAPVNVPQPGEAVARVSLPQPTTEAAAPAGPVETGDFAAPVPDVTAPAADYTLPTAPTQPAELRPTVTRASVEPDYAAPVYPDTGYAVEPSPVYRPIAQPALSRAIQRAAEMTGLQPDTAGTLGAGPAAIARRYISPVTMERYRALQQTTDKVLRGEQPTGIEPVSQVNPFAPARPGEAARIFEPRYVPQRQLNPAVARRNAQKAQEAQRIQEETGTFLAAQETAAEVRQDISAQPFNPETRRPAQFNETQGIERQAVLPGQSPAVQPVAPAVARLVDQTAARPADIQRPDPVVPAQRPGLNPPTAQETTLEAAQAAKPLADSSTERPVERPTARPTTPPAEPSVARFVEHPAEATTAQPVQERSAGFEAVEAAATVVRVQPTGPVTRSQESSAFEPAYLPSATVVRRASQPSKIPDYDYGQAVEASDPFEDAIPSSLLENDAFSGEVLPEVQRLTGNRLRTQLRTTQWANTLPTLRNNPGIAAGPARIARQLEDSAAPEIDNWSAGSGAGVYIAQNWLRRKHSADAAATETQDRIFSLAETSGGLSDFQPQLMRAMAFEEVAAPLAPNRVQPGSPVTSPFNPTYVPQPTPGRPGSINPAPAPGVSRTVEAATSHAEFAITPDQPVTGRPSVIPADQLSPAEGPINPTAPMPRVEGQTAPFVQRISPDGQPVSSEAAGGSFESPAQAVQPRLTAQRFAAERVEGQSYLAGDVPQTYTADGQLVDYGQTAATGRQYRAIQRRIQARGLQPTALQRVFKRMDTEAPAIGSAAESADLGFGSMPLSYVAQPGLRRNRVKPLDLGATADQSYIEDNYNESGLADYAAQPLPQVAPNSPVARVYREQNAERPATRTFNAPEILPGQTPAPISKGVPVSPTQADAQFDFEGAEASPIAPGREITAIQRVSAAPGQPIEPSQPQYFKNSLEASWLTPENRLIIERLPGGSSALQRLFQAPRSSFEPRSFAAGLNLSTLRNNPGLASQVARVLEESGRFNVNGGWSSSFPLSYVPQRRTGRSAQVARQIEAEDAAFAADFGDFEGALPSPNEILPGSVPQPQAGPIQRAFVVQPERARQAGQGVQPGLNTPPSTVPASQSGIIQTGMNRETAARIQRNLAGNIETTQSGSPAATSDAPAVPSFTVTGDYTAQLQRHYQNLSTGQLNGPSSLVMRLLTADGKAKSGLASFAGHEAASNYDKPNLNYIAPPLLLQKVSKYTPENGMAAFDQMAAGPSQSQGPGYATPGEVLRVFDKNAPIYSRAEEKLAPSERTAESVAAAELTLPRLRQTNTTLQRINSLETTNHVLELAHHVDEAAMAADDVAPLPFPSGNYNPVPFNLPRSAESSVVRRVAESVARMAAAESAAAPLRMTDAPAKRPVERPAEPRFLEVDAEVLADAAEVRPEPFVMRLPDKPVYRTPLEAAAARHSADGPNIGQGQILQPLAIQRKAAPAPSQPAHYEPLAQPVLHNVIKTSVGRSLEHTVQRKMSNMFGSKFNDVRVHTGDEAAQATKHVGAEAFTLGSNIYFAPGRYQPETQAGQALIGHELTHVVQQSSLPSLGHGRIPETSHHGQTLEHHAIANEQLILRHLASPSPHHDDHDHDHHDHANVFVAGEGGRLNFSLVNSSQPGGTATATIERSYIPMADQNQHPPINRSHLRSSIQRVVTTDGNSNDSGNYTLMDNMDDYGYLSRDTVKKMIQEQRQEDLDELARKVYQIIRDELMIERERGFGPSNKFF